jgi:beta-exotoxin I transport system permease protein
MRAEIARLDVSLRRRSLIGYTLGMAAYALVVVALYPAFRSSHSLDSLVKSDSTAAALLGVSGPLSSSGGWLNGNIYANFFPLMMLLMTVGYGAAALAGQDEEGTLCLVVALPIRRVRIVLLKVWAMALQASVLAASVAVCVLIGRSFELSVAPGNAISISAAVLLMGLDFGILAMAVGALAGRRATAIGVGATLAAASYLLSSLAPVVSWIRPGRYASLFYWAVGDDQISKGVSIADYAVLIVVGLIALCAAATAFQRLDLH